MQWHLVSSTKIDAFDFQIFSKMDKSLALPGLGGMRLKKGVLEREIEGFMKIDSYCILNR
jgi:hypothetical protein